VTQEPTRLSRAALLALNLFAVVAISYLDWLRAPSVIVGILLGLPILLASTGRHPLDVWIVFVAALIGFEVAAIYGQGLFTPASVWIPNRILVALSLPGTLALGLFLQRLRHIAEQAAAEAERSSDLNRLLVSLLAHDLRSPLALAIQTLVYLEDDPTRTGEADPGLVTDVRARLRRSLTTIDQVLGLAREPSGSGIETTTEAEIAEEIRREVEAFTDEAQAREKRLVIDVGGDPEAVWQIDLRVLRQAISILVDNAIRHSLPGTIRVSDKVVDSGLEVRVADPGPIPGQSPTGGRGAGLGLGLDLCRALILRAGGRIDLVIGEPTGKAFVLRLPIYRG
jgi:signal transduction histidine kinase